MEPAQNLKTLLKILQLRASGPICRYSHHVNRKLSSLLSQHVTDATRRDANPRLPCDDVSEPVGAASQLENHNFKENAVVQKIELRARLVSSRQKAVTISLRTTSR